MVDVSGIGCTEYVNIETISNLVNKGFCIINEGWLTEFKDKNGVPKKKLVIPVELLSNKKMVYWVVNDESLSLWKMTYGHDSFNWLGKFGTFKVKAIGGYNSIIGEPKTIDLIEERLTKPK